MAEVLTLAFPFFGLILLGFFCGKLMRFPEEGLRWMNFFIVYVALPPLFFKLIAATPFEELKNWPFVIGTTLSTYLAFVISLAIGLWASRGDLRPATIQAVLGSYSNIGYMGPGLTLAALGSKAAVPTALIFVFDNALLFTLVPFLMAMGSSGRLNVWETTKLVIWRVVSHPFNIATFVAVLAAYFQIKVPTPVDTMITYLKNAAAPVALFTLGVTVALRPLTSVPFEVPAHLLVKLVVHPLIVLVLLSLIGGFEREWVFAAVLMAALPPALNVFVLARQYDVYVERASTGILVGTLVSTLTVTGLLYLIATDTLPYSVFGR
ncbi:MAG TPA: AEC family transporter [Beijerinckiaceae bacterium]|nr:AEC family transporter [Beijerinckiaceae bacterium]